jgi:hypothetical protein
VSRREHREGAIGRFARELFRAIEAEQRRVSRLAGRGVLARGLAEIRRRAFDVEHVVHDLEREAEVGREGADGRFRVA